MVATDIGRFIFVVLVLALFGFLAWRLVAIAGQRIRPRRVPDLGVRLDQTFNGSPQAVWRIRGGGIYLEDLVREANARGYRLTSQQGGVAIFERAT